MTCTRRLLLALLLSLALAWPANDTLARGSSGGGGGGGGRSSFSSSSRSSSSSFSSSRSSSGSSWGSSKPGVPSTGSSWGSATASRPSAPASAADSAMAVKVNRAGNTTSRSAAIAQQSAPRTYPTEPVTRPADIPWGQTLPNGSYAPIYYDSAHQGYGFWNAAGQWMMWSAIMNSGGHNNAYYGSGYGPGYGGYGPGYAPYQHHSLWPTLMGLLILGGIVVAAMYIYRKHREEIASCLDRNPQSDAFASSFTPARPMSGSSPAPRASRPARLAPWLHFPPGSFITLSDSQSLEDSQKRGEGFQGIRFAVESTLVADDTEGFASWVMLRLNDSHQRLLLVVKAVDDALDHRIYYANEDFRPARREEVVRRGDTWLFEAPEDENNFEPADLRYTAEIVQTTDERAITYVRKDQGERHANATETPNPLGLTQQIATVVEYSTSDATENPELLVLEIGAASRRTGEITLYLGCPIRESEIDLLKAASV